MASITVYSSLTRSLAPLAPARPPEVRIYVCGVTPYAETHIGHARPSVVFDVVGRWLRRRGYRVTLVQNFTDVDDRIIARAAGAGEDALALADRYAREYLAAMDRLGVERADAYPRVSGHIGDIIRMIEGLVEKRHAYVAGGDVYYAVRSFPEYGKLSGRSVEELLAGARVEVGEHKAHPADFALWKAAKPGEPSWPSPWGPGRPGWHIECSAMSLRYLGSDFDIHGGGLDLIFPHHENEIAQSEAYTGEPFARVWMHVGLVNMGGEKMSKSLGNVASLDDLLERHGRDAVRLYLLNAHYRRPIEFSEGDVAAAKKAAERLANFVRAVRHRREAAPDAEAPADATLYRRVAELEAATANAMDDDFNTAEALAALFSWIREVNAQLQTDSVSRAACDAVLEAHARSAEVFGFALAGLAGEEELPDQLQALLREREEARGRRDWARADALRAELLRRGVVLEDTPQGTRWKWAAAK